MTKLYSVGGWAARTFWILCNRRAFVENHMSKRPRLLVDVSAILQHDAQTGIQRVVRAVWSELQELDGQGFELCPVYATYRQGYCYAPLDFLDPESTERNKIPVRVRGGDIFLGLDLSAQFLPKYRKQLRAWRTQGATIHILVYDLLPLLRPEWFNPTTHQNFRRWFDFLARDADQAICISRQVSRDLRDRLRGKSIGKQLSIVNMQLGGDIAKSRPSTGLCKEVSQLLDRLRFRPAVLMVGTIEPRKGYDVALSAFEHLWTTRGGDAPDLVIVGKGGWKTGALQSYLRDHPEHGRRLHWLDAVSDEGLCRLYDASRGLLMASLGEGFGLPLAEAVVQRRHVLARDIPVFREQELPGVTYFENDDPAILGEELMRLVDRGETRTSNVQGLLQWTSSVQGLLGLIGISTETAAIDKSIAQSVL